MWANPTVDGFRGRALERASSETFPSSDFIDEPQPSGGARNLRLHKALEAEQRFVLPWRLDKVG